MDLKKMKGKPGVNWEDTAQQIPELKKELTSRGLVLKGNKQELVTRLSEYLEENDESILDNGTEPTDAILTPEVEEDLLEHEDEPSLLDDDDDDDEEEPAVTPATVTKVTSSPVTLQRKPIAVAPEAKPSAPTVTPQKIAITPPTATEMTSAQKKASRAERFNTPLTEDAKKQARLEKFGGKPSEAASAGTVPKEQGSTMTPEALEKLKKRSERFGTAVSPVVKKTDEMDRLLKRKHRFGVITNTTTPAVIATEKKRISTEGATDDTEAKKKKRAERFGLP